MQAELQQWYRRLCSQELRYWLYKQRHPREFRQLRTRCDSNGEVAFSLSGFAQRKAIFVHITKSAGTSVGLGLFGMLPSHYTAWQYRVIFGRSAFNRYFKFTFVRNPWDRLYSAFSYLKGGGWHSDDARWADEHLQGIDDFNQFVTEWLNPERLNSHIHFWPQSRFIVDGKGRVLVDYLGYFETLDRDFPNIAARVNPQAQLVRTNSSRRGSYLDVYTPAASARVAQLYAEDIRRFGYRFDGFTRRCVVNGVLVNSAESEAVSEIVAPIPDLAGPQFDV